MRPVLQQVLDVERFENLRAAPQRARVERRAILAKDAVPIVVHVIWVLKV